MKKQTTDQKSKPTKNLTDKLLSIPGIRHAIKLVRDYAWLCAIDETLDRIESGELGNNYRQRLQETRAEDMDKFFEDGFVNGYRGDSIDEWLEWFALEAGPEIAELWGLSEGAGDKLAEVIYWGQSLPFAKQSYFLPFVLMTDAKDPQVVRMLGEKYLEFRQKHAIVISPKGMQQGHIKIDVTYLPYRSLHEVYEAILLCRQYLRIQSKDLQEGAPASIDTKKALQCTRLADMRMPSKKIARELGFTIYSRDNPSGSYPLFRKYLKRGREIQQKLDTLSTFLAELNPDA